MPALPRPTTVPDALAAALARDPSRPLVTHLGTGGTRTELSVRTYDNNVAKAANLLRDDADLQPGQLVALTLPLHWQTSLWLGACALVSGVAWLHGSTGDPEVEVAVLGPDSLDAEQAPLTLATALHPLGMPFATPLPGGVLDAGIEVRGHGDRFVPGHRVGPDDPWLRVGDDVLTQSQALVAAHDLGRSLGVAEGGRVLCALPLGDDVRSPGVLALLALPLACDAAVVLLTDADADTDEVAVRERCDVVLS